MPSKLVADSCKLINGIFNRIPEPAEAPPNLIRVEPLTADTTYAIIKKMFI